MNSQTPQPPRRFARLPFFDGLRARVGKLSQAQVEGAEALLSAMEADPAATDVRELAYLLATAWHETAQTLQPIVERGPRAYFNRYDPVLADTPARRATALAMGNVNAGDGYRYRGRGYVQLTWADNYRRLGDAVGRDLLADPDLALRPEIAYVALARGCREGWFTGRRLGEFIAGQRADYLYARKVVNGMDRAVLIAGYARDFEALLRAALIPSSETPT